MACRDTQSTPLILLHIPHGAGTFICSQAIENNERTCSKVCLCDGGDTAYFHVKSQSCEARLRGMVERNITFTAIERGLLEDEFCPDQTILYFRNPLDRIDSLISSATSNVSTLIPALEKRAVIPPFHRGPLSAMNMRFFDNFAVRSLVGSRRAYELPVGSINETHFEQARANMMRVGFLMTDRFLLQHKVGAVRRLHKPPLCWKAFDLSMAAAANASVNHHRPLGARLSPAERDHLARRWNRWDMQLYELAWQNDMRMYLDLSNVNSRSQR